MLQLRNYELNRVFRFIFVFFYVHCFSLSQIARAKPITFVTLVCLFQLNILLRIKLNSTCDFSFNRDGQRNTLLFKYQDVFSLVFGTGFRIIAINLESSGLLTFKLSARLLPREQTNVGTCST